MIRKYLTEQKKEGAQGVVEFALILPILLLGIVGIMEFGRMIFFYASITSASREGARYGSAVGNVGSLSQYEDCDGIRDAALKSGFFAGLGNDDITIQYDDGITLTHTSCPPSTAPKIQLADRVVVTVNGNFLPVVPLIDIFFPESGFDITSTTARTIIKEVRIEGTPLPPSPPSCYALTLNHAGLGSDPVASPVKSNVCIFGKYLEGESISLSGAAPELGWQISGWTGTTDDASNGDTNTVTMPANDHAASVVYTEIPCYPLDLDHTGEGSDPVASPANSIGCLAEGLYVEGEIINLSDAVPDMGWEISGWTDTDQDGSTADINTVTMIDPGRSVFVDYTRTCYPLVLEHTGQGSDPVAEEPSIYTHCSADGLYAAGESISLSGAVPTNGWEISHWAGTDNDGSTEDTNTVTMPFSTHTASVFYNKKPCHSLKLSHSGEGSDPIASPSKSSTCSADGLYNKGEVISLSGAVPTEGWEISGWIGTENDGSTVDSNTVIMPASDHNASVVYTVIPYP